MGDGSKRMSRWYFGGIASCGAACITHPLDTLKVQLQTQQGTNLRGSQIAVNIIRKQGFTALYNGLSASLLRQLFYSTTRFAIYEMMKQRMSANGREMLFSERVMVAGAAGACGGFIGTPGDMVNVRMQNDVKLPLAQRRNYAHAIDGLIRVTREEGVPRLFRGASSATFRAMLMTIGQLSFYDQIKKTLLESGYFSDNLPCHFASSLTAGAIATTMTQPVDVIKTRAMNASPGEFRSLWHIITYTGKLGPMAFFKGYVPAFVRLGPHTIFTFIFFEQLRKKFGILLPVTESED